MYSASGSPPNPIVPRGWPAATSNTAAAFHHHRPRGVVWWCVRAGLSSLRMMNDPRVPHNPLLHATRTLSWPYRLSASTFGQRARPPSPPSPSLVPFHHDIPSPLAFPPTSSSGSLAPVGFARFLFLSASTLVLFLVYFSHPRTVEMQFASELLLLPPSQPVAASNNRRRGGRLTTEGNCLSGERKFQEIRLQTSIRIVLLSFSQWRKGKSTAFAVVNKRSLSRN